MAKLVDVLGRPHSGVVPYAVVALVDDNDDPDEYGRVKVRFPTLSAEPLSYWLRQATPNGGLERGLYALPEVDDEVLVIFMQGSQDIGVIIGQFWNGVDTRPENAKSGLDMDGNLYVGDWSSDDYSAGSTDDADNDRRFWKSRSGHVIGFDDTDGSETIQVWDSKGNLSLIFDSPNDRIILSNNVGDIHIRAKNDLFLEAGNNMKVKVAMDYDTEAGMSTSWKAGMDISSEADMNSEHKAGMNFDIKAGMGFKAKADMTAKIEGGMTFEAKGGMSGKLEGGMMATIKGAMVMIN